MPKISVIVPVYKAEKYLPQCVKSILDQTFSDLELLLIDDGSPDNSGEMCDHFATKDSRIRVIHKENGGVSSARNAGLDAAIGEYITFVDSDDYIDICMYEKMMAEAEKGTQMIMCDCMKEFSDRSTLYTHPIRPGYYSREQIEREYFPHLLIMENVEYPATISNWLLLFRRELVENIRYLAGVRYSEDLLFGARLMYEAQSFCYLKGQAYYHYRMNVNSATHKFVPDKWNDYRMLHAGIQNIFAGNINYDFSRQIDLCLLFFLYNAVGEFYRAPLSQEKKKRMILIILNDPEVRSMFQRLDIASLPVSRKQKIITWLYCYRVGISSLIWYFGG